MCVRLGTFYAQSADGPPCQFRIQCPHQNSHIFRLLPPLTGWFVDAPLTRLSACPNQGRSKKVANDTRQSCRIVAPAKRGTNFSDYYCMGWERATTRESRGQSFINYLLWTAEKYDLRKSRLGKSTSSRGTGTATANPQKHHHKRDSQRTRNYQNIEYRVSLLQQRETHSSVLSPISSRRLSLSLASRESDTPRIGDPSKALSTTQQHATHQQHVLRRWNISSTSIGGVPLIRVLSPF